MPKLLRVAIARSASLGTGALAGTHQSPEEDVGEDDMADVEYFARLSIAIVSQFCIQRIRLCAN